MAVVRQVLNSSSSSWATRCGGWRAHTTAAARISTATRISIRPGHHLSKRKLSSTPPHNQHNHHYQYPSSRNHDSFFLSPSWVAVAVAAIPSLIWIRDSFVDLVQVQGSSMEPTLQSGDWVLVRKADAGVLLSFLPSLLFGNEDDDEQEWNETREQQQQQQQQQQQKQHGPAGNSNPTEMSSSSVSSSLFSSGVMTTDSSMLVDDLTGPLNFSIDRSSSNSHAEYHSSSYPSTTSANASASVIAYPSHLESTAEEHEDEDGDDDDQDDDVSMRSAGNSSQYSEEGDASMSFASNSFHNGTNTLSTRSVNSSTKHHKQRRSVHFHRTVTIHDLGHAYTNTMPLHQVQQLHAQERPPLTPQDIVNRWYTRDECASFKKHMLKSVKSIRKIEDLFKAKNRTSYMMNMQTLYEECMQLHNSAQQQQQQQDYIPIRTDWFTTLKDVPGNLHTVGLEKFAIHNMHQTIIHARRQLYSKIAQLQQQHGLVDSTAALSLHKEATKPQQQQQQQQQQQRNQTTTLACNPVLEQELADISRQMTRANRLFYTYLAQVKAVAQEDDESATTTSVESPLSTNARRKKRGKR